MVAYQEFMYSIIQIEDQNERESVQLDENVVLCRGVYPQHSLYTPTRMKNETKRRTE